MAQRGRFRPGFIALAAVVIALAIVALSFDVEPAAPAFAQADATATMLAMRTPVTSAITAATPAAPVNPETAANAAPAPEPGNSMTASLGGSDIAVSSVGGSYEVDGPKRKAKKVLKLTPTP